MSQLDILPSQPAVDFTFSSPSTVAETFASHSCPDNFQWGTSGLVKVDTLNDVDEEIIFPDLPALKRGHPDLHLRNGIMKASAMAANNMPDAEQAFFVADLGQVYIQYMKWKLLLPEIEPFFAVKSNPDPYVLRLLAALGAGFDCASSGEITNVLRLGVDSSRIIFANPCKATSFVRHAEKTGVSMMTFDNTDELYKIARSFPAAKLVIRIHTDDSKALCRLGLKFGASLVAVPTLLAKARELELDVIGVSFHVGSGCFDSSAFAEAVGRARTAFDMGKDAGYHFSMLDVGGGFEDSTFESTASVLSAAINTYFPDRKEAGLRIIAEPGRYFVSKAFSLAANIIARRTPTSAEDAREALEESNTPSVRLYINDGVYGAFSCILFDHQKVQPYVLSLNGSFHVSSAERLGTCSVWGPTCDSIDCVCPVTQLPDALRVGDWLGFDNMGAYSICAASHFNGFEVSNVTYTIGGEWVANEVKRVLKQFAEDA